MFRRSLSSEAAASLITAFTRAASDAGNFRRGSNHTDASAVPPRSRARSRMIADDSSPAPIAALASVLAISIAACSTACGGRSAEEVWVKNSARSRATVIAQSSLQAPDRWRLYSRRANSALQVAPPARRHVGDDRNDAASGRRCDLHRRTFDVFRRQGIERDVGAGLGEHPCNSLTDAA